MDSIFLGREIRRVRKELGLTQKLLAEGICGQSEISKIEKGIVFPSMEILGPISNRLKKPISYWFEAAISDQYYYIGQLKTKVNDLLDSHQYEQVYNITSTELEKKYLVGEHKQFFLWSYYVSAYHTGRTWLEACIHHLEDLLKEKIFYTDVNQTMYIRNALAYFYRKAGNKKAAFQEFETILQDYEFVNNKRFFMRVLFNYANALHNEKRVEDALAIVNQALAYSKETKEVYLCGNLYFLKGECLIDLNQNKGEISECFQKALFFFREFDRTEYIQLLFTHYREYVDS